MSGSEAKSKGTKDMELNRRVIATMFVWYSRQGIWLASDVLIQNAPQVGNIPMQSGGQMMGRGIQGES